MKQWIRLAFWLALGASPRVGWAQAPTPPPILTLEECLTMAPGQNRTLRSTQQAVQQAEGRIMEARGAGRPQLNLSSGATISSRELGFPLAVALNEQQQLIFQEVPLYPDRTGYAAAGVSQVIDISGLIRTGITTASLGKQVAQRNVQSTRNGVLFQVKAAYYDVLHAQALTAVAQEAVDNAQTRRKTAQALVEAGISSRVDIFRADAAIAAAQQSLIAAQNAVEVSKAGLNDLLGRDVNTPLEVQSLRKRSRL